MVFLNGLLTFILVLDCFLLILLVLIQLPKKEAGAGLAFGGAASDALFGAGSGTVLTKVTKYAAGVFFVLAIVLAMMQSRFSKRSGGAEFQKILDSPGKAPATSVTPAPTPVSPGQTATNVATNALLSIPATAEEATPAPTVAPPTNSAPAPGPQQ